MVKEITDIAIISLLLFSLSFCAIGFIRFRVLRLTERNSICAKGILIGFREYGENVRGNNIFHDYVENGKGRLPLIEIEVDGKIAHIASAISDYDLTSEDIGKQLAVRYRRGFGITLLIDDEMSIRNYNQLQNVLFWSFEAVAIILAILSIIAYKILPLILGNI